MKTRRKPTRAYLLPGRLFENLPEMIQWGDPFTVFRLEGIPSIYCQYKPGTCSD